MKTRKFNVFKNNDVISAQISDHHPIIHEGTLFWNVMMRGRYSESRQRYNNGFGLVEIDQTYINRLKQIGKVIAEIVKNNPEIETINLCEGPIEPAHVKALVDSMAEHKHMDRLLKQYHNPNKEGAYNWGLIMFADKKYSVQEVDIKLPSTKLKNRFQLWKLTLDGKEKYIALTHIPYSGDVHTANPEVLSADSMSYRRMINNLLEDYADEELILVGDFNLAPYHFDKIKAHVVNAIPHHNSTLFHDGRKETVTVDGILLSDKVKRRIYKNPIYSTLFARQDTKWLEANRHQHPVIQREYDKQFGLVRM